MGIFKVKQNDSIKPTIERVTKSDLIREGGHILLSLHDRVVLRILIYVAHFTGALNAAKLMRIAFVSSEQFRKIPETQVFRRLKI
jgi:hypothetical protein